MAALNMLPFRVQGHPHLEELRRKVSYTVSAGVLQNNYDVVIVDRLRGFRGYPRLNLNLGLGSRLPAYCTSMGKLLFAHLSGDEQKAALEGALVRRGPNIITNRDQLLRELGRIYEAGFAINDEELVVDVRSIAMPVRFEDVVIGAVDITAPTSMVTRTELVDDFGPHLSKTTELISKSLASAGGNGSASTE
jgi:IclR family pca regulon transcriptional regulator